MTQESKESLRPFALLIGGMVILIGFAIVLAGMIGGKPVVEDEEAVNNRIVPAAKVTLAAADSGAAAGERTGEQLYQAACMACHDTGAAGAPKTGDKAAWGPRLGQGLAGLLKSALNGKNAMPPKGGSDANDTELARAIVFMANKSGGSLKEPVAK